MPAAPKPPFDVGKFAGFFGYGVANDIVEYLSCRET